MKQKFDQQESKTSDSNELNALLKRTADGSEPAFEQLYDLVSARVYGLSLRILRSVAHAEEVTQEVMVEVWRTAKRFDANRGSGITWILTMTHRRAVDRVRTTQASTDREERVAATTVERAYDQVDEAVATLLEQQALRHCLRGLTTMQHQALALAYYHGHTYREVAQLLGTALPTIKTRMRDGLIRLRDCLGVVK